MAASQLTLEKRKREERDLARRRAAERRRDAARGTFEAELSPEDAQKRADRAKELRLATQARLERRAAAVLKAEEDDEREAAQRLRDHRDRRHRSPTLSPPRSRSDDGSYFDDDLSPTVSPYKSPIARGSGGKESKVPLLGDLGHHHRDDVVPLSSPPKNISVGLHEAPAPAKEPVWKRAPIPISQPYQPVSAGPSPSPRDHSAAAASSSQKKKKKNPRRKKPTVLPPCASSEETCVTTTRKIETVASRTDDVQTAADIIAKHDATLRSNEDSMEPRLAAGYRSAQQQDLLAPAPTSARST